MEVAETVEYDVVVVGGGVAGLAAAVMLGRSRRRVVVVDAGEPRNAPSAHLHGFLSRDGMAPAELLTAARREVLGHGYEVRDSALGVIGGDNRPFTLHQAQLIRQWSDDVVFFPHRIDLETHERKRLIARGVQIVDGDVARIVLDETGVRGVELAGGRIVARTALFVGPRFVPRDELLTTLGCELGADGWIATDRAGRTSVDGVWAAGNVVDSPAQLINAAAGGSAAAIALNHYLLDADIEKVLANDGRRPGAT